MADEIEKVQSTDLTAIEHTKPTKVPPIDKMDQIKNLMIAGAKCVPVLGNVSGEIFAQVIQGGIYSPETRLRNLQFDWLIDTLPGVLENIEKLIKEGINVEAPDVGAILEAALDASRKTTGKKRQYLKNALENAFSMKMYEEGQVLRFFKILEELEYGDIFALKAFNDSKKQQIMLSSRGAKKTINMYPDEFPVSIANLLHHHVTFLSEMDLLRFSNNRAVISPLGKEFIWFVTAEEEDLADEP